LNLVHRADRFSAERLQEFFAERSAERSAGSAERSAERSAGSAERKDFLQNVFKNFCRAFCRVKGAPKISLVKTMKFFVKA